MEYVISQADKAILREVARKQLELANQEKNQQRIQQWYQHNALQGERPMVHLEMWTFAQEIIPQRLKCQGEFARWVETTLYCNFLNQELFDDDRVTPDYFPLTYDTYFHLFGLKIQIETALDSQGHQSVGHQFQHILQDLEEDYDKLKQSVYGVDLETTEKKRQAIEEAIGDILPVRMHMNCLTSVPT